MTHIPVLLQESIDLLQVRPGCWYIDATVGSGGHTRKILKKGGKVLGIDQDQQAIRRTTESLGTYLGTFLPISGNFAHLKDIAQLHHLEHVDGILFDLGVSSEQLDDQNLGLSFQKDSPLDMRLVHDLGVTAADLLNSLPEKQLAQLFREYGDEPKAKQFARQIVALRSQQPFTHNQQLTQLALKIYHGQTKIKHIHPATKVFQALRIAVNSELDNLQSALPQALDLLKPGGRLVVISFHSGEDRIVKNFFRESKIKTLTSKPITPSKEEIANNPRARSAKLRVGEKI